MIENAIKIIMAIILLMKEPEKSTYVRNKKKIRMRKKVPPIKLKKVSPI